MSDMIGFLGFGEVARHIGRGLAEAEAGPVLAFSRSLAGPNTLAVRGVAAELGIEPARSVEDLAERASLIFSATTANAALAVAGEIASVLSDRHLYVDLNAMSPERKRSVATLIAPSGARFVDGAIMGPVPREGHRTEILVSGDGAEAFIARMGRLMRLEAVGQEVGDAAAMKVCRSIILKGLPLLLMEALLAARHFKAEERVLSGIERTFPGLGWAAMADYTLPRTAVHARRRVLEMEDALATLASLGLPRAMTSGTVESLRALAERALPDSFKGHASGGYRAVLDALRWEEPDPADPRLRPSGPLIASDNA